MNSIPTKDDYDALISQLGAPEAADEGPDIIATHRRQQPQQPRPEAQPRQTAPQQPRQAAPQQPRPEAQPQRRTTQYTRAAQQRGEAAPQAAAQPAPSQRPQQQRGGSPAGRRAAPQQPAAQPQQEGGQGGGRGGKKRKKSGGYSGAAWLRAIVISLALVGCAVFLAFFALESANDLFGLNQEDKQVEVNIDEDMDTGDIIGLLNELGIVDTTLTFRVYASLKDALEEFQPGQYVMNKNFSYDEVIIMLRTGNPADAEKPIVQGLTFYEGMSAWEIAERLEENKVCDAQEFIDAVNNGDFSDYEFMDLIPEDELRYLRLEGFLFPDTYDFYVDEDPESVVRRFLNNFQNRVTDDIITQLNEQNLTLYEGITLASIIQAEASDPEQMGPVSSVFHNRLDTPGVYPRLESDVTRDYIKTDITPHIDIVNEEMNIAYDTYQSEGLPVGPIDNPGLDAILAAANPDDTPYFFFVTDIEGTYYYAVTFDEHVVNVYRAAAVGDAHGVATDD